MCTTLARCCRTPRRVSERDVSLPPNRQRRFSLPGAVAAAAAAAVGFFSSLALYILLNANTQTRTRTLCARDAVNISRCVGTAAAVAENANQRGDGATRSEWACALTPRKGPQNETADLWAVVDTGRTVLAHSGVSHGLYVLVIRMRVCAFVLDMCICDHITVPLHVHSIIYV